MSSQQYNYNAIWSLFIMFWDKIQMILIEIGSGVKERYIHGQNTNIKVHKLYNITIYINVKTLNLGTFLAK